MQAALRGIFACFLLLAAVASLVVQAPLFPACADTVASGEHQALPRALLEVLDKAGKVTARLAVEVAASNAARARGLMFRRHLAASEGMLFLWPAARPVAMWMKNTFIPLDMVFIGADGRVARVHENARPHDLTPIFAGAPVIAVLEVNAGAARRLGLRPGARLRLPPLPAAH